MKSPHVRRILIIISIAVLYTYGKAVQLMPHHPLSAIALAAMLLFIMLTGSFVYRARPEVYDKIWFRALSWAGSVTMGLWATFIILSMPFDFLRLGVYVVELVAGRSLVSGETFAAVYFWLAALALGLVGSGFFQAVRGPILRKITVYVQGLHPSLHGFKIAQISDLHVGPNIRKPYVEEVARRTREAAPDVIVLTGDIVDAHADSIVEHLAPLASLEAPHGRFYVTGNHEYYWNPAAIIEKIAAAGMKTLFNAGEKLRIGDAELLIAGITDPAGEFLLAGHAPNLERAAEKIGEADFKILLSHRPGVAEQAEKTGFDLQFSGHTHSGQFFPFSLFIGFAHRYSRGLYRHGRMWLYVNPGTGFWGPANRLGVAPEISLITLAAQEVQ